MDPMGMDSSNSGQIAHISSYDVFPSSSGAQRRCSVAQVWTCCLVSILNQHTVMSQPVDDAKGKRKVMGSSFTTKLHKILNLNWVRPHRRLSQPDKQNAFPEVKVLFVCSVCWNVMGRDGNSASVYENITENKCARDLIWSLQWGFGLGHSQLHWVRLLRNG